jgi:hypothetical protein
MDPITLVILGVLAIVVVTWIFNIRNKEGKIKDTELTSENFLKELEGFEMKVVLDRKKGFTEKDVQKELETFFKKHFETVYREYTLEGFNAKAIDFDLGQGKIGIEVKLAREAIKEANWDRALGQLGKYAKKKYSNKNLIVIVAGMQSEKDDHKLKEFKKDIEDNNAIYHFITIKGTNELTE